MGTFIFLRINTMSLKSALSRSIREIRIHVDAAKAPHVKKWIESNYASIKKVNPSLPFLVREGEDVKPTIIARYDFGHERKFGLSNLNEDGITKRLELLSDFGFTFPKPALTAEKDETDSKWSTRPYMN